MSIIALPCNIHCSDNKKSLPHISISYLVLGLLLASCSTMNGEKRGNEWVEVRPPQYPGPTQLVLEWSNCSMEAAQGKQQGVGRWLSHNPDGQTEVWSRAPRKQGQGARMNEHSRNSHIDWHRKGKHLNVMMIVLEENLHLEIMAINIWIGSIHTSKKLVSLVSRNRR